MTLNGVMAVILRYFTEFGSFRGALCKSGWKCRRKKFTFAISSPGEFLVLQSKTCNCGRCIDKQVHVLWSWKSNELILFYCAERHCR